MSTTEYPGFPSTAIRFGENYIRIAVKHILYLSLFSLGAAVIVSQTIPELLVLLPVSIVSYSLHIAGYRFRYNEEEDGASLTDVFGDDSLTDFAALVVGIYVPYTAIYLLSVVGGVFLIGITGNIYIGVLATAYIPVLDFAGNRFRWYLSLQVWMLVGYIYCVHSIGVLTRVTRESVDRFFPGYRFEESNRPTPRRPSNR